MLRSERGTAITEFTISIPFLLLLTTAVCDVSLVLSQYLMISHAVHAGVRQASSYAVFDSGTFRGPSSNTGCTASSGTPASHYAVQERVSELVGISNSFIDSNTLCVTTNLNTANQTLVVTVDADYRPFFPGFGTFHISVEAQGPVI